WGVRCSGADWHKSVRRGGALINTVASHFWALGSMCLEFACSPSISVGFPVGSLEPNVLHNIMKTCYFNVVGTIFQMRCVSVPLDSLKASLEHLQTEPYIISLNTDPKFLSVRLYVKRRGTPGPYYEPCRLKSNTVAISDKLPLISQPFCFK
uniref:Uncharacterized protein n=1 Tax=Paramormyrops kingsleyae TaxID=1676925 RepID=A0A3B3QIG5_9TELE